MKQILITGVVVAVLLSPCPSSVQAQAYISTTAHRVPFSRLDSLQKLLKSTKAVGEEAKRRGGILDNTWLIHAWGGEYNVVQVVTWKSWSAIVDTTLGLAAATRKVYPDSTQRKRINDGFDWVFDGVPHVDNIYLKVD